MKLKHIFLCLLLSLSVAVSAQRVTITANGRSAESVFKELMRQTGKTSYTSRAHSRDSA